MDGPGGLDGIAVMFLHRNTGTSPVMSSSRSSVSASPAKSLLKLKWQGDDEFCSMPKPKSPCETTTFTLAHSIVKKKTVDMRINPLLAVVVVVVTILLSCRIFFRRRPPFWWFSVHTTTSEFCDDRCCCSFLAGTCRCSQFKLYYGKHLR